jgi:hypothetical protein
VGHLGFPLPVKLILSVAANSILLKTFRLIQADPKSGVPFHVSFILNRLNGGLRLFDGYI